MISNILKTSSLFYKLAKIPLPIRDLKYFADNFNKNIISKINELKNNLEPPSELVSYLQSEGGDIVYFFQDIFGYKWLYGEIESGIEKCDNLIDKINDFSFDYLKKSKNGHERRKALNYLLSNFNYTLDKVERIDRISQSILEAIEYADSHIEDYKKEPGYYEYYLKLKKVPELSKSLLDYYKRYQEGLSESLRELSAPIMTGREDNPPESENEEILYHTTINADKIYNEGFVNKEFKTQGLGGSTETNTGKKAISFTADLYIAKEIARCLKEVIMIANGEVDGNDILEWSSDKEKILNSAKSLYGDLDFNNPNDVFNLYRSYLAHEKRYDPLFYGIDNITSIFGGKNPNQVGIIAAKVNMRHPDISYHTGMLEYRVPFEAIINIEKLIK